VELNWSTYLLEIVNFMVLVWILKRYLYQPVLDVIARRRQAIEQTTGAADAARRQAEELKNQFEGRLADWAQEKQKARQALQGELDELRRQRLADLEAQLAAASERARPKSMIRALPSASIMMLAGLRSRWTTPRRCAATSPSHT